MSKKTLRKTVPFILFFLIIAFFSFSQRKVRKEVPPAGKLHLKKRIIKYGTASYYDQKFNGRKTANGEKYNPKKFTAACNVLPLNTWIKVTNLRNHKSIILKINDRLSKGNSFLIDVSKSAAKKLTFFGQGIAKVKVEQIAHY